MRDPDARWKGVGGVYFSGPSGVSVRVTRRAVPTLVNGGVKRG